ncbi:MAG TPA: AsmA family protein [Verrucomicrobiae bacterium]
MTDATVTSPAPRKRRGWLRVLVWLAGIFVVLLVVVYFVATSSAFFKGVILPKASAALNATITVSDASISPFSQVVLRDFKLQTTGAEPLVAASEVRLRYSLMAMMRGNIDVDEVAVVAPTVALVENPDGTRNLDPILKKFQEKPAAPTQPAQPSKPAQIDIKKITLSNGTIRRVKLYAGGKQDVAELSNVNVELANLKNGGTGKLTLGTDIRVENNPPAPQTNGLLLAKVNGSFDLALTPDLKPGSVQGTTRLDVTRAEGSLAQAAALAAAFECNITPVNINQVALRFLKGDMRLAELRVSGPFNLEKSEGRLSVELLNVDKNVLNLAGASSGLDFGPTTISSTNQVELASGASQISVTGQFNLNKFQVTRANQTTPPLDLRADYSVSSDLSNVLVRAFTLTGVQKGNQFLRGELPKPLAIALRSNAGAGMPEEGALNLAVNHLNLADWNAFTMNMAPAGDVNASLKLLSQKAGKQITFDLSSEIANLTAVYETNQITGAGISLAVRGQMIDTNQVTVPEYRLQVSRQNQELITLSGSATYERSSESADAQLNAQVRLARLLGAFPMPDATASSGAAEMKAHLVQKQKNQNVTGNFALTDFSGRFGSNAFRSFGSTADFDIGITPQQVQIRKISGQVTDGTTVGGSFDMAGTYDLTNKATQLTAKLANFNQNGLHTFLDPMLGDKKLVSVALNANAAVQYDPKAASTVKADLAVTNLVVNDPTGQIPAKPLEARMQADVSMDKDVADIRKVALGLTPTSLAPNNEVRLTGRADMSQPKAIQGNLKLAADTLDFTTYYDLFAAQPAAAPGQPAASAPAPGGAETAAPTNSLPLTNFIAEAAIGRIYLHEVQITNLQATVKINGPRIDVNPFKLWLNGAPASTTVALDLGVPGYQYDVSASAVAIPLAPLVNTFQPKRKGILSGTMTAQGQVSGTGTTGESLQKTLKGQYDLSSTNLNLSVDNIPNDSISTRLLKTLVSAIVLIPDLARNPAGGLTSLAGSFLSGSSRSGASAGTNDLSKSPIDSIIARGTMGSGQVVLQQTTIQSRAFRADAPGTITLKPVLTNSPIDIPVSVSLDRAVAQRINMAPANTPTNVAYVKLPDFLAEKGTLGEPKMDINKTVLLGAVLEGSSGLAGKNSGLLQGLGSALTGGSSSANTSTNASTNRPGGLLQGLGGLLGGGKAPATTNAPATNQSPGRGLLDNLLGPKKK